MALSLFLEFLGFFLMISKCIKRWGSGCSVVAAD
jgi:hypothetical protein